MKLLACRMAAPARDTSVRFPSRATSMRKPLLHRHLCSGMVGRVPAAPGRVPGGHGLVLLAQLQNAQARDTCVRFPLRAMFKRIPLRHRHLRSEHGWSCPWPAPRASVASATSKLTRVIKITIPLPPSGRGTLYQAQSTSTSRPTRRRRLRRRHRPRPPRAPVSALPRDRRVRRI